MPTPSSNAPDPPSLRSFPFSSCPDPEELGLQQPSPPQSQPAPATQLASNWTSSHRLPDYSTTPETRIHDEDDAPSRSITMSPGPQSDSVRDVEMEDTEGLIMPTRSGADEDGPKQTEEDDGILTDATGNPVRGGGMRDADGEATRARTTAGTAATASGSSLNRRKQRLDFSPATPASDDMDTGDLIGNAPRWTEDSGLVGMGYEYSQTRMIPTSPSSLLRAGSRFVGTQQSERQRYDVQVEIKHVDLRESYLCGYLKIQGLTDDHPTLTTYFEGEIIGAKYGFITQHPSWGATDKIDLSHWGKFTAFRPYQKLARKGAQALFKDVTQRENIFMRWKERFLVPDHRVRTINGASFEGFYYICFNQVRGEISGIYFHSRTEKFQMLELKHVEDKGCHGAMEFR